MASSSVLGNPQSSWYQWVQDKDVKAEAKPILLGKMSFPSPLESPDGPCTNGWLDLDHCLHPVSESVSCLVWSSALFIFEAPAPSKEHRLWRRGRHEKRRQNRGWERPARREIQKGQRGLPWWLSGKESAYPCWRHEFDPWSGKIPCNGATKPVIHNC